MIPEVGHYALVLALVVALVQGTLPLAGAARGDPGLMELGRTAALALEKLGPKSPPEVSRFLREQAVRANANTQWIIRNALAGLPEADQTEVIRLLRS